MQYFCCDEVRRAAVRAHPTLNGIDYVEVGDPSQGALLVYLLKQPPGGFTLTTDNVRIEGGERIRAAASTVDATPPEPPSAAEQTLIERLFYPDATYAARAQPAIPQSSSPLDTLKCAAVALLPNSRVIQVSVNTWGDFSPYVLRLVNKPADPLALPIPLDGMDPLLSAVKFSFNPDCQGEFDCAPVSLCPPAPLAEPEIDYLARDYNSFRQLILDRMASIAPGWQERNPADLGVTLVELLAYVGDHLSYRQDAIATEAYLGTARRRISVRRHARLVDYFMHDGCNARVWVQIVVNDNAGVIVPAHTQLFTQVTGLPARIPPGSSAYDAALAAGPTVFETIDTGAPFICYQAHNQLSFYTWGAQQCCLPAGATHATLAGAYPNLQAGDVLIFQEVLGLQTGQPEDADPTHRWPVRLTSAAVTSDPLGGEFLNPPASSSVPITEIAWGAEDALPFAFCLNGYTDTAHNHAYASDVSVARGNIALADHGYSVPPEWLGAPPPPTAALGAVGSDFCAPGDPPVFTPPFRPTPLQAPLTQAAPHDATLSALSASAAFRWQMGDVLPEIQLEGNAQVWTPHYDLLDSDAAAPDFVAEVDDSGLATLRFGDGQHGMRPASGDPAFASFTANYRVGNGAQGNIGAQTISHIVSADNAVTSVWNPLAARGGVEPEPLEHVRQSVPAAYLTQERAVTADDYATVATRFPQLLSARATFRWTGSWRTVFLTAERAGDLPPDRQFVDEMLLDMERYRMAGHDLDVDAPNYVALEMAMSVCAKPNYFRDDVRQALLAIFNNRTTPDGRLGLFNVANFSFGETLYLSPFYAAAQAVEGVSSAKITVFRRRDTPGSNANVAGKLTFGRLEIPRLDNDPDFPERGVFHLVMEGGK
jgi:hypothetical protein